MDEKRKKPIGELLLEEGVIDDQQLKAALAYQRKWGGRLGTVLVSLRFVTEDKLLKFLSTYFQIPMVNFEKITIPPTVINSVPQEIAEKFNLIPLAIRTESGRPHIFVVMSDPTNLEAIDSVQFKTGMKVKPVLASDSSIAQAITDYYEGAGEPLPQPPTEEESVTLEEEIQAAGQMTYINEATTEASSKPPGDEATDTDPAGEREKSESPAEPKEEEDMIIFAGGKEHHMSIASDGTANLEEEIPPAEPESTGEEPVEELEPIEEEDEEGLEAEEIEEVEAIAETPSPEPPAAPPAAEPGGEPSSELSSTKGDKLARALTEILIEKNVITLEELKKKLKL